MQMVSKGRRAGGALAARRPTRDYLIILGLWLVAFGQWPWLVVAAMVCGRGQGLWQWPWLWSVASACGFGRRFGFG